MFDDLVESTPGGRKKTSKPWTVIVSAAAQAALVAIIMIIPLLVTPALPKTLLSSMLLAPAPPPPAAPPPPPAQPIKVVRQPARLIEAGRLIAPKSIPKQVNLIKEEALPPDVPSATGVSGGVVGRVPGGQMGGVLGGIIGGSSTVAPPPPPPKEVAPTRLAVGGDVQQAKLINKVIPIYPPIARQMRIQGTVRLHAIISKDGHVIELTYVSGPPQLIQAARDAVIQWRFSPTLLNGVPVEVECVFEVTFNMQ